MSEYTPTTEAVKEAFANEWDSYHGFQWSTSEAEGFDRWLAEVERAAAEKALDSVGEVLWVHRKSGGGPDDRYAGMMRARFLVMQSASAYRREETE